MASVLTEEESFHFQRALYRIMLCCGLYGMENTTLQPEDDVQPEQKDLFKEYVTDEIYEIYRVAVFLKYLGSVRLGEDCRTVSVLGTCMLPFSNEAWQIPSINQPIPRWLRWFSLVYGTSSYSSVLQKRHFFLRRLQIPHWSWHLWRFYHKAFGRSLVRQRRWDTPWFLRNYFGHYTWQGWLMYVYFSRKFEGLLNAELIPRFQVQHCRSNFQWNLSGESYRWVIIISSNILPTTNSWSVQAGMIWKQISLNTYKYILGRFFSIPQKASFGKRSSVLTAANLWIHYSMLDAVHIVTGGKMNGFVMIVCCHYGQIGR